jgi:hypothetical protein
MWYLLEKFLWDGHVHVARQLERQLEEFLTSPHVPRSSLFDTFMPSTQHIANRSFSIALLKMEAKDEFLR